MKNASYYFDENGVLSKVFEGYKPREQQLKFSEVMHEAIAKQTPFIGEANTGVGKSLAALTAANTVYEKTGKAALIVTSSILLQEQYMDKDIPILSKAMQRDFKEVLAKGKANYVCKEKMLKVTTEGVKENLREDADEILKWAFETTTGDVSELAFQPDVELWEKFSIQSENECRGKLCPFYKDCHYYETQRAIPESKIVVCNYHYFFEAIQNNPKMIPDDIGIVIFDEFHEIINIARNISEVHINAKDFDNINSHLAKTQRKLHPSEKYVKGGLSFGDEVSLGDFMAAKSVFHNKVKEWTKTKLSEGESRFIITRSFSKEFRGLMELYLNVVEDLCVSIEEYIQSRGIDPDILYNEGYNEETTEWYVNILKYYEAVLLARTNVTLAMNNDIMKDGKIVWVEVNEGEEFARIIMKPFSVEQLIKPIIAGSHPLLQGTQVIAMSATLAMNGKFDHLKEQLGLTDMKIETEIVDSPFNLSENMLWYLPKDCPAGNEPQHANFTLKEMEKIAAVLLGRTLCLFTSIQRMKEAGDYFKEVFLPMDIQVLIQGDMPKKQMIEAMRKNPHTIIVATRSFFTGVDIQGDHLRAVLIDKLPFPIQGDPINIHLGNLDNGFNKYLVPEMAITLKQGFGRLIRSHNDNGVVACFDGRLRTGSYKNRIFASFGHKINACTEFKNVVDFLGGKENES